MIRFSVVTVVKDDLRGLKKSRESLEAQKYKGWTHIIIDGKSSANTLKYLKSLPKENTIFVSESDSGIYNAMNKGWKLASPDSFVFFLNARDVFTDPRSLSEANDALKKSPSSNWGCTTHEEIQENGEGWVCKLVSPPAIANQLYAYGYRSHQAVIMKAKFIAALGGFDEAYKIASDWDLIVRALIKELPTTWIKPIARFELGGISSTRILEAHMELRKLRKIYLKWGIRRQILDDLWCAYYLKVFGFFNYFTPIINLNLHIIRFRSASGKKNLFWKINMRRNWSLTLNLMGYRLILSIQRISKDSKKIKNRIKKNKKVLQKINVGVNRFLLKALHIKPYQI